MGASAPLPRSGRRWVYVIVRVFSVFDKPHVGDVILDPFSGLLSGEIRLAERDLYVTVAALVTGIDQ